MQVWNVLHTARWKCRTQKIAIWAPLHNFVGYIVATKTHVDNRKKKLVKQQYLLHMSSQYGELWPTNGWDLLASLGHPCKFQRVLRLGSVTTRHSGSGHQPNFAVLNRGHHLYLAGWPLRWHWPIFLVVFGCYCVMLLVTYHFWFFRPVCVRSAVKHQSACDIGWLMLKFIQKFWLSAYETRSSVVGQRLLCTHCFALHIICQLY